MPGTIRFNIDPYEASSDDEIIEALKRLRLWDLVKDQGGLDKAMEANSWSIGQRQLLCLARAMVRGSRILILDEATSRLVVNLSPNLFLLTLTVAPFVVSVDTETESIMHEVIETDFAHHTVLSIMHRLAHITKYDKIALLDNGSLAEFDTPAKLLSRDSRFKDLYQSGGH